MNCFNHSLSAAWRYGITVCCLGLVCAGANPAQAGLLGAYVNISPYYPDTSTLYQAGSNVIVSGAIEYPAGAFSQYNPNWQIDVTDGQIKLSWMLNSTFSYSPAAFNGWILTVLSGPDISSAVSSSASQFHPSSISIRNRNQLLLNYADVVGPPFGTSIIDLTTAPNPCPAILMVTTTNDSGPGSLRQAVLDANSCPGTNVIEFSPSAYGTIRLTSGELLVTDHLFIHGPGATNVAVDGNAANRVFHLGSNTVVNISGLTIKNGRASSFVFRANRGGGIFNDHATLTLTSSMVIGNRAAGGGGGICNDGSFGGNGATVQIIDSTVSGNSDSGIYNDGQASGSAKVEIIRSTLSDNTSVGAGGGLFSVNGVGGTATVAIVQSTLRGNSAVFGGGVYNDGGPRGDSATVTIINSTLSANMATNDGGGIFISGGSGLDGRVQILNSTLSGNVALIRGSDIYNLSGSLEIGSSILNGAGSRGNIFNQSGRITSLGYNLCRDGGITNFEGGIVPLGGMGDQINTDPKLGPLQDNGGLTFTHALLPGSPAIDQGTNFSASLTDQRGFGRTLGNAAIANALGGDGTDVGAVESESLTVVNTNNDGSGSLRQAILDANSHPGANVINFSPSAYGTILLRSGELLISDDVFINGPGTGKVTIDGNTTSRVFHVGSNTVVTIAGMTITNGWSSSFDAAGFGGGIFNDHAVVTVSNCTVSGNYADVGGGLFNVSYGSSGRLLVVNSTVSGNGATIGGGIESAGFFGGIASLVIVNSTLSDNGAYYGGAVDSDSDSGGSATVEIRNSTLSGNSANRGGAIANAAGLAGNASLRIVNSTLMGNSVIFGTDTAGGIYNPGARGKVEIGSTILNAGFRGDNIVSFGTVTSLGYNLSSDGGGGFLTALGDQINTDPMLGPLQDNGGPTFTHAFLCRSLAIDRGKNFSASAIDQRGLGFVRTFNDPAAPDATSGEGTDVGAFEAQQALSACNQPPVAIIRVSPLVNLPGLQNPAVIAIGDANACITLDGALSSDPDQDPLTYLWFNQPSGNSFASGITATECLDRGTYTIVLVVTDTHGASANAAVTIEVISLSTAVELLIATVNNAPIEPRLRRPLIATLEVASASFNRGELIPGLNQLKAFQSKVGAQIGPIDSALAQLLIQSAQGIVDALNRP